LAILTLIIETIWENAHVFSKKIRVTLPLAPVFLEPMQQKGGFGM